ncbi:MAG TPA: response regulator [Kofleriaceae bacterium]|nr:response regulator [Kofleriaceae bacterium]
MSGRVLIVDDEFGLAEVVAEMLSERGHDVDIAINGESALARMAEARPDLVLTDVMMPIMDGPALLGRMRADPELATIPVILMTAIPRSIPASVTGMHQGLLVKPFTPAQLFAAIAALLDVG